MVVMLSTPAPNTTLQHSPLELAQNVRLRPPAAGVDLDWHLRAGRAPSTITTTASTSTIGCQDNATFIDMLTYFCSEWKSDDCNSTAGIQWLYDADGMAAVRRNCPATCGTCPSTSSTTMTTLAVGCQDNTTFIDMLTYNCLEWESDQCNSTAGIEWLYDADGMAAVRRNCPATCGTCPSTANTTTTATASSTSLPRTKTRTNPTSTTTTGITITALDTTITATDGAGEEEADSGGGWKEGGGGADVGEEEEGAADVGEKEEEAADVGEKEEEAAGAAADVPLAPKGGERAASDVVDGGNGVGGKDREDVLGGGTDGGLGAGENEAGPTEGETTPQAAKIDNPQSAAGVSDGAKAAIVIILLLVVVGGLVWWFRCRGRSGGVGACAGGGARATVELKAEFELQERDRNTMVMAENPMAAARQAADEGADEGAAGGTTQPTLPAAGYENRPLTTAAVGGEGCLDTYGAGKGNQPPTKIRIPGCTAAQLGQRNAAAHQQEVGEEPVDVAENALYSGPGAWDDEDEGGEPHQQHRQHQKQAGAAGTTKPTTQSPAPVRVVQVYGAGGDAMHEEIGGVGASDPNPYSGYTAPEQAMLESHPDGGTSTVYAFPIEEDDTGPSHANGDDSSHTAGTVPVPSNQGQTEANGYYNADPVPGGNQAYAEPGSGCYDADSLQTANQHNVAVDYTEPLAQFKVSGGGRTAPPTDGDAAASETMYSIYTGSTPGPLATSSTEVYGGATYADANADDALPLQGGGGGSKSETVYSIYTGSTPGVPAIYSTEAYGGAGYAHVNSEYAPSLDGGSTGSEPAAAATTTNAYSNASAVAKREQQQQQQQQQQDPADASFVVHRSSSEQHAFLVPLETETAKVVDGATARHAGQTSAGRMDGALAVDSTAFYTNDAYVNVPGSTNAGQRSRADSYC
jgi:hypothetical protein